MVAAGPGLTHEIRQGSRMRNHGLRKMKDSKTAHPRLCSKERLFSNRNAHITRQLTYHNDLMREPWFARLAGPNTPSMGAPPSIE